MIEMSSAMLGICSGGVRRGGRSAGKFVLEKGSTGKFHFNLHAANGQVIATSQHYESKESALHGIESVKHNAPDAVIEDKTEE
jgi:uncharacterized protein